jgi:CRISPR-associated endoribonuclease Cas6
MLYSAVLELECLEPCTLSSGSGYQAYGLFLKLLRSRWPDVSERLHKDEGPKPFTLSPVRFAPLTTGLSDVKLPQKGLSLKPGASAEVRLTCLDESLMEKLIDSIVSLPNGGVVALGDKPFKVKALATRPGARRGCRVSSFEELYQASEAMAGSGQAAPLLTMRFASPTTFRSGGQRNVVFPTARLVFNSLLARWNHYAPPHLRLSLPPDLDELVTYQSYRLSTRLVDFGAYQERGVVGTCRYELAPGADAALRKAIGALAGLACFAGVGAKTTMGMGQCWRLGLDQSPGPRRLLAAAE